MCDGTAVCAETQVLGHVLLEEVSLQGAGRSVRTQKSEIIVLLYEVTLFPAAPQETRNV